MLNNKEYELKLLEIATQIALELYPSIKKDTEEPLVAFKRLQREMYEYIVDIRL